MKGPIIATMLLAWPVMISTADGLTLDLVTVGNPGNGADPICCSGFGAVPYTFNIGKTEITNAQYVVFLNAVAAQDDFALYSPNNEDSQKLTYSGIVRSGTFGSYTYAVRLPALGGTYHYEDKPVAFIDFGDAMRFANWMHNGQPTGHETEGITEDGAYALHGAVTNTQLASITRNPGARWWIPSVDEWYKAAYHKNDGPTANYWKYATGADIVPDNNLPPADTGNSVNYAKDGNYATGNFLYPLTDAGAYTLSESPYGTFDQSGNESEWTDTIFEFADNKYRYRSSDNWNALALSVGGMGAATPEAQYEQYGFRIASRTYEPSSVGDYNHDGNVDAADYVMWRSFGGSAADYNTWRANYGLPASGSGSFNSGPAVPEPAVLILAIVGATAFLPFRRMK